MILQFARRHRLAALSLVALAVAFATRVWFFGDPVVQIDEQFYLMTGDRLLHGAIPYVDIWDRKPVGIFLLYAGIRLLGGEGIYQYQVVATLFAAATALLISLMALRFSNGRGAALAGAAYLLWLLLFDGAGGQTPVFYNLFVAAAGALVMQAMVEETAHRRVMALGGGAMLLMGIALQVKYSALFEGIFFGLALMWKARRLGAAYSIVAAYALVWIALALLPTVAAAAWYAHAGHLDAFLYANFESIFRRGSWPAGKLLGRILTMTGLSLPLLLCVYVESRSPSRARTLSDPRCFALCWLAAAIVGLLLFGTYFTHYFLPVLVPLTLSCAALLGDRRAAVSISTARGERRLSLALFLVVTGLALGALIIPKRLKNRGHEPEVRALASAIKANLDGCMLVFDGEPILYLLTQACLPTSRVFPNHLNEGREAGAVGLDPQAEVRRIMLSVRPDIIVNSDRPDPGYNAGSLAVVRSALAAHYRPIFRIAVGSREQIVYKRVERNDKADGTAEAQRATPHRITG
jgi:hypothetical protein